jgi:hypothetical protein
MHILHYVSPLQVRKPSHGGFLIFPNHVYAILTQQPKQRHYIRILWMVPIYSIESWLALRFNEQKLYLETMREAYEAYVVYSFFKLMREFFGPKDVRLLIFVCVIAFGCSYGTRSTRILDKTQNQELFLLIGLPCAQ